MAAKNAPDVEDSARLHDLVRITLTDFLSKKEFDSHQVIAALAQANQHAYVELLYDLLPRSETPFQTLHAAIGRTVKELATQAGYAASASNSKDLWSQDSNCVLYTRP